MQVIDEPLELCNDGPSSKTMNTTAQMSEMEVSNGQMGMIDFHVPIENSVV